MSVSIFYSPLEERKLGEVDIQIVNLSLMFLVNDVLIDIAESLDELARR